MLKVKLLFFFNRLFYGSYSPQYYFTYKKFVNKSPYPPCYRDSFIAHIELFMDNNEKYDIYSSSQTINFTNIDFGTSIKALKKIKGQPYYFTIERIGKNHIIVLGYNEDSSSVDIKSVYYFYKDKLFMGEYVFTSVGGYDENSINKTLEEKYLKEQITNKSHFIIKDNRESVIIPEDTGFEVIIKYYCRENKEAYQLLKNHYNKYRTTGMSKKKTIDTSFLDAI